MVGKDAFRGLIPAVITPMNDDLEIDVEAFDSYLRWIVDQGVAGIAVNVDTGEGPTLTSEERVIILEIARERLKSKVLVAGLTAASTKQAVEEAERAKGAGADVMLVFPNTAFRGNPSNPEAIMDYHSRIADGANIDVMLFQLQDALGGVELGEESLRSLASLERVVAIKEATFDFSKYKGALNLFRELEEETGREIAFLTGNDNFIFESFLWGCDGALIGAGAQDTARISGCYRACLEEDWEKAIELARGFQPLVDAVFAPPVRSYRARTKACLYLQGVIPGKAVRPPLVEVKESELEPLREVLRTAELQVVR
ncbi:dihydrodipicolinate synthase/N-acetylneuraminate lyase [Thaumarchaeota archaeon SCGC AB-539-E09]|nr:dihydrodipicolinate synthase/N-acetylneuraminate lyase [Thaumarchaeota archaeon SCGC AB-539-E09]